MRNLHKVAAGGYAYAGLASWVFQKLDPILKLLPTLVHDSIALKDRISGLPVPEGSTMYLLDIKDFFLSGHAVPLAEDVAQQLDDSTLASLLKDSLTFLLDNQFIDPLPNGELGYILKCVLGTGMGLLHSGHVANLAFYARVEKKVMHTCTPQHGIISYSRYFDDIIIIAASRASGEEFISLLLHHQAYFKILCTEVSQVGAKYLDTWIDIRGSHVIVYPMLDKEIILLRIDSGHHKHVHKSWPGALVRRTFSISTFPHVVHANILKGKYVRCNASTFTIARMEQAIANYSGSNNKSLSCATPSTQIYTLMAETRLPSMLTWYRIAGLENSRPPRDPCSHMLEEQTSFFTCKSEWPQWPSTMHKH